MSDEVKDAIVASRLARDEGRLLEVPFVTISDYLHMLRCSSESLAAAGRKGLMFLAAAVSDFYVPFEDMAVHKIQSKGGSNTLDLSLKPVPKTLGYVRDLWCPDAMSVSFKLETDSNMLMKKAKGSIARYNMHAVLANMLQNRYEEIHVVTASVSVYTASVAGVAVGG